MLEVRRATVEDEGPTDVSVTTDAKEDAALAAWVTTALAKRRLEAQVRRNRNFNSPAILQHMVGYCGIEEHATLRQVPSSRRGDGATDAGVSSDGRQ